MKKILVALLVLALGMPLMADVAVTGVDMGLGQLRITVSPSGGAGVRGVALVLERTGDATVASTAAVTATGLNTFIDYALTAGAGYTAIGQGHPAAKWDRPGGEAVFPDDSAKFSLCAGYLDENGTDPKGEAYMIDSFFDVFYTGTSATIAISLDTIRGGIVGDDLGAVTVTTPTVDLTFAPPTCTVTMVSVTKAVNPGFVNTDVTSVTAVATSDQGHALQYSFNWGSGYGAYGAATQTNTYAFAAAGTETVSVKAKCTIDGAESAPMSIVLTRECLKYSAVGYADWKLALWNRPKSWCFARQCRGDATGSKTGFWVQTNDLNILKSAYKSG
jgi:hypothetical protein